MHAAQPMFVRLVTDPPGVMEVRGASNIGIVIHVGPSVHIACDRGGQRHRGLTIHGDVDIIPAGTPSRWEIRDQDTALILGLPPKVLQSVAEELDVDPDRAEILNRFQIRDRQIEQIGWALKTEMEHGYRNGALYIDSLGRALAVHLLRHHSTQASNGDARSGSLSGRRLKQMIAHIEDNLTEDLSLKKIAATAGLSVSHCNAAFRKAMGQPIHRYVIERRVERARSLLEGGARSISQVALDTGFAHQSHLAFHMRRVLGVSPGELRTER
jgi:AraC family transcriptional regulator